MRFNIDYHKIAGYGHDYCGHQDQLFGKFEKKGYTGKSILDEQLFNLVIKAML